MTEKIQLISELAFKELREEFPNQEDYEASLAWLMYISNMLAARYNIIGELAGHPIVVENQLPLHDKRIARIMHILATSLELMADKNET